MNDLYTPEVIFGGVMLLALLLGLAALIHTFQHWKRPHTVRCPKCRDTGWVTAKGDGLGSVLTQIPCDHKQD